MDFWQEYLKSDIVSFSGHHSRRLMVVVCPNTADVSFDELIKVLYASFLYRNIVINK